jgi:hypothetical protein
MRIAVCISGHLRTLKDVFPDLSSSLVGHQVDYFVHVWDKVGHSEGWHMPLEDGDIVSHETIKAILDPTRVVIEKQEDTNVVFPQKWVPWKETLTPQRLWPAMYKVRACDELRRQFEKDEGFKYDRVIRTRADLRVRGIDQAALDLADDWNIVVGIHELDHREFDVLRNQRGMNDKFAIGTSDSMTIYANLYDKVNDYCEQGYIVLTETLLYHHITTNSLDAICAKQIKTVVIRKGGEVTKFI